MHIAVEGCSHGELDTIYNVIQRLEQMHGFKVDLLLCCGDFQSVRNEQDLKCMACPIKYMSMHDFYRYHSGEKKAPVLTIFIGGNHEASNYLQELPYGGWVAPNIYYMGYAGVVRYGGLRIGGLSGIYKGPDYLKGHYEKTPYSDDSIRSVYHVRNLEVFRLKQLSGDHDVFMSHDWPRGIYHHGPKERLMRLKKHFRSEIENNTLGSRAAEEVLKKLRPKYWFSGHLHVRFPAVLQHKDENTQSIKVTKFLALDKCLPRRDFLQVIEVPSTEPLELSYDAEWLTILRLTNHLLSVSDKTVYMPGPGSSERYQFTPSQEEIAETVQKMEGNMRIPLSFSPTAESYQEARGKPRMDLVQMPRPSVNPQSTLLCERLGIDDPLSLLLGNKQRTLASPRVSQVMSPTINESELNITMETSKLSTNPDEVELSDDENPDIIMEMKFTPDSPSNPEYVLSPIRREGTATADSPQPYTSSPLHNKESRPGLVLSNPKIGESSEMAKISACDSSSTTSSLSESECSPRRSPQAKRLNEEKEGAQMEAGSSSTSSSGSSKIKKLKRRNQAMYSSTEEEI
ncbi:lariat debranching enzyme B-like [Portunus trituberculatus]|uniref:lariat debranching enzyme B-like n=1 Tax=Portunus trituberculatus TaxID=210409 RepID=UPI001E1CEE70|nr:lariat debranching enzyme B-like [Portunus trituberculatus]